MTTTRKNRWIAAALTVALVLSMLPTGLVLAQAQSASWTAAAQGSWMRLTDDAAVLQCTNRLAGVTPTWGENPWSPKDDTVLETSTDGKLCQGGDTAARTIFTAPWGDWLPLTYDLGQTYALQDFVVASSGEGSLYAPHLIRIYVADSPDSLYTEQNRVVQAEKFDVTGEQWQFRADTAKTGRYVGFEFYCADGTKDETEEPNAFLNGQRISNIWYGSLRIGEIGAYAAPEEWLDAEVGTYRTVAAAPENNLLAGLTPTGNPYNAAEPWTTKDGTDMALLTDGQLSVNGSDDFVGFELFGAGQGSGDWRQFTFDMSVVQTVREFLLGSCGGDTAGLRECWVQVYAGTDRDTLYSDGHKVAERKGLTATERNVLLRAAQAVSAQYVGFRLYTPAGCAWGSDSEGFGVGPWYDTRRLGELGAYAEKPVQDEWRQAAQGSWMRLTDDAAVLQRPNRLAGVTPTWGENPWLPKDDTVLAASTDGKLCQNGDTAARTVFPAPSGDWIRMSYTLDAIYALRQFVLAGSGEGSGYVPHLIRIYVGTSLSALYAEENRVVQAEKFDVTGQDWEFQAAEAREGQYVGFELYCPDGTKSETEEPNAFLNGQRISNIWYACLRIGEIGAYGDRVGEAPPEPVDLIAGKEPTDAFQIEARGIDNRTAVNEKGEPGTGNTGTLKDAMALVFEEPASNLTDGDYGTRGATSHGVKIPMKNDYDMDYQLLQYDTPWQVLVYHLGGESKLSEIRVTSSDEYNYHLAGVQYYAAYRYADLFKNESLLYTTGGEYYHYDAENERYMQDVERDTHDQRTLSYTLTQAQAAETYRFVAVVVTRPYGTYDRTYPEQRVVGYASARISEIEVEGVLTQPEVPPTTAYEQQTVLGTVRVQVSQLNADDIDFFETVLHGFTLEAAPLPEGVERNTYGNWLTVDGEQMYTIRLVDGAGVPLTDEQLGGRLVGITVPAAAAYHQTMGRVQDGRITPMLNAYTRPDGTIQAAALNYPVYHNLENNREDAIVRTASVSLVYLKFNDLETIDRLNGMRTNTPLQAAFVAGESRMVTAAPVWRYAAGGGVITLLLAAGFAVRRKRRTAGKGGKAV